MKEQRPMCFGEELEAGIYRDMNRRKVNLTVAAKAEIKEAWDRWQNREFNSCIEGKCTRALYDAANAAGAHLVAVQSKHGVWLIHPVNARAGLKPDDPRIIG